MSGHAGGDAEIGGDRQSREARCDSGLPGAAEKSPRALTVGRDRQSLEIEAALERMDVAAVDQLLRDAPAAG